MADMNQLLTALRNADAAGDVAAATRLAQIIKEQQGSMLPPQPPQEATAGIGEALVGGAKRIGSDIITGVTAPFVGGEEAAQKGIARQEQITERPGASLEEVQKKYKDEGLWAATKEAVSQIPSAIAEQAPFLATMWAGGKAGAMLPGTPQTKLVTGFIGAALAPFLAQAGSNIQRQAEEQIAKGEDPNISEAKAYGGATAQAALDVFSLQFGLGRLLGIKPAQFGTEAAEKLARENLALMIAKGTGKTALAEVPTEISQQLIERAQAGLDLTSPDAVQEYLDTGYTAGLISPIGGPVRAMERSDARNYLAAKEQQARQALDESMKAEIARINEAKFTEEEKQRKIAEAEAEIQRQYQQVVSNIYTNPGKSVQDIIAEATGIKPKADKKDLKARQKALEAELNNPSGVWAKDPFTQQEYELSMAEWLGISEPDLLTPEVAEKISSETAKLPTDTITESTFTDMGIGRTAKLITTLKGLDPLQVEDNRTIRNTLNQYLKTREAEDPRAVKVQEYLDSIPTTEEIENEPAIRDRLRSDIQVSGGPIQISPTEASAGYDGTRADRVPDNLRELARREEQRSPTVEIENQLKELQDEINKPYKGETLVSRIKKLGGILTKDFRDLAKDKSTAALNLTPGIASNTGMELGEMINDQSLNDFLPFHLQPSPGSDTRAAAEYIMDQILNNKRTIPYAEQRARDELQMQHDALSDSLYLKEQETQEQRAAEFGLTPQEEAANAILQQESAAIKEEGGIAPVEGAPVETIAEARAKPKETIGQFLDRATPEELKAFSQKQLAQDMSDQGRQRRADAIQKLQDERSTLLNLLAETRNPADRTAIMERGKAIDGELKALGYKPQFAETLQELPNTNETPESITSALEDEFGPNVRTMQRQGRLRIVNSVDQLPPNVRNQATPRSVGAFDGKTSYLIANRVTRENARRVLLHEVGEHYGLERMLGSGNYKSALNRLKTLKNSDDVVKKAWNDVKKAYPQLKEGSDPYLKEVMAKVAETAPNMTLITRLRGLIKNFLTRLGLYSPDTFTARDLQDLLIHSLRSSLAKDLGPIKTDKTGSAGFKQWFGKSKITKNGKPMVVYHGTTTAFDTFKRPSEIERVQRGGAAEYNDGIYFTDSPGLADVYAKRMGMNYKTGSNIIPAYLKMENPYIIDDNSPINKFLRNVFSIDKSQYRTTTAEQIQELKNKGYDGVIIKPRVKNVGTEYVVFDNNQIQPATTAIQLSEEQKAELVGMSPEAVNNTLERYGNTASDELSGGWITMMSPEDFLSLTTGGKEGLSQIERKVEAARRGEKTNLYNKGVFDVTKLAEGQASAPPPFLELGHLETRPPIDSDGLPERVAFAYADVIEGELQSMSNYDYDTNERTPEGIAGYPRVKGHEGRHRAVMARDAGIKEMPVLILSNSTKSKRNTLEFGGRLNPTPILRGQFEGDGVVIIQNKMIPLSWSNKQAILDMMQGTDIQFMEVPQDMEATSVFGRLDANEQSFYDNYVNRFDEFRDNPKGSLQDMFIKGRINIASSTAGVEEKLIKEYNGAVNDAMNNVRADILLNQALEANIMASQAAEEGKVDFLDNGMAKVVPDNNNINKLIELREQLAQEINDPNKAKYLVQHYLVGRRFKREVELNAQREQTITNLKAMIAEQRRIIRDSQGRGQAQERNNAEKLKDRYKKLIEMNRKAMTDITDEQMNAINPALEYANQYPVLTQIGSVVDGINRNRIDMLEKAGYYDKDTADFYRSNLGYVPLFRVIEDLDFMHPDTKEYFQGFANLGREYEFKGSERDVDDVLNNMLKQHFWAVNAAVRNNANFQTAKALGMHETVTDPETGNEVEVLVTLDKKPDGKEGESVARVFINGEAKFIEYSDPNLAIAIQGAVPAFTGILAWFGQASKIFRLGITANPVFQSYQVINDAISAGLFSGVKKPFALAKEIVAGFAKDSFNQSDAINKQMARLGIAGGYGKTAKDIFEQSERKFNLANNSLIKNLYDKADKFASKSDLAQRRGLFVQTLLETGGVRQPDGSIQGGNEVLAMNRALNIINWQKRGLATPVRALTHVVPFLNAYIQGIDVLINAVRGKGIAGAEARKAQMLFFKTAMTLMALNGIYAMLVAGDDDYDSQDDRTKFRNYFIPGTGFKMPVRAEISFLTKYLPEQAYQYMLKEGTNNEIDSRKLAQSFSTAFSDAMLSPNLFPQLFRAGFEVATNYDFYNDRPLIGMGLNRLATSEQYNERTSEFGKWIGSSGIVAPINVDHLIRGYTGTLGSSALYLTDAMANLFYTNKLPDRPLRELPVISPLMMRPEGRDMLNDFYDLKQLSDEVSATLNNYIKLGKGEQAREYRKDNAKMIAVRSQVNNINNRLKSIRDMRKLVVQNPRMSAEAKREKLEQLDKLMSTAVMNVSRIRRQAGL